MLKPTQGDWLVNDPKVRANLCLKEGESTISIRDPRLVLGFNVIARVELQEDVDGNPTSEGTANAFLMAASPKMLNALKVFILDPKISAWLQENDPQALKQAKNAIEGLEG